MNPTQASIRIQRWWRTFLVGMVPCAGCGVYDYAYAYDPDYPRCADCYHTALDNYKYDRLCDCRDVTCDTRCGTLWCGCIDVCRGRCGFKDNVGYSGY
jgi:hypothetical protein